MLELPDACWSAIVLAILVVPAGGQDRLALGLQTATTEAMRDKAGAAVVLDVASDKILAKHAMDVASRRLATPGSTVKPFTLLALMASNRFDPQQRVLCRRKLTIAGKKMDCSHAEMAAPLDAAEALAYSCNYYFASAVEHLAGKELEGAFQRAGLLSPSGLAPDEALGQLHSPINTEQVQLLGLGEEGIAVTPLALLQAYRGLALRQRNGESSQAWQVVSAGLRDSAEFGMGHEAQPSNLPLAGKTGTAASPASSMTHGWFVGYVPADHPEIVLVVYLEHGRGVDAAAVSRRIFAAYQQVRGAK